MGAGYLESELGQQGNNAGRNFK